MMYQHVNVREKIKSLANPTFCNLHIRDKLYGTISFSKRKVFNSGKEQDGFYIRYFTFLDDFRSNNQTKRRGAKSLIRDEVHQLMNGEGLEVEKELLLYAYVDAENIRSKRLIDEFGFQKVGTFLTIPFSRLFPKASQNVQKLDSKDWDNFQTKLNQHYSKHQLFTTDQLQGKGNYFVIRENGEVVCGVQGIYDQWQIMDLPGWTGKIMMKLVPRLPVIRKLFDPDYRFVFLEAIYCKPGFEKRLAELFASVLAHYQSNSGIICLDPTSHLYAMVKKIHLGLTHNIMGEKEIEIVVKTKNNDLIKMDSPFFISGYDVL